MTRTRVDRHVGPAKRGKVMIPVRETPQPEPLGQKTDGLKGRLRDDVLARLRLIEKAALEALEARAATPSTARGAA